MQQVRVIDTGLNKVIVSLHFCQATMHMGKPLKFWLSITTEMLISVSTTAVKRYSPELKDQTMRNLKSGRNAHTITLRRQ